MTTKNHILIFLFILFCTLLVNTTKAQNNIPEKTKNLISGVITDSNTGKPIPHVEVFISGTTCGSITNSSGEYILEVPFFPCTFVASHVSYESFIIPINSGNYNLNITLTPSNHSINEVKVTSKNKRKRNLRFFYSHFIPEERNKIEIPNDSVLFFERSDTSFLAFCYEPLILINKYLGYKIRILLEEFTVLSVDGPGGKAVPFASSKGGFITQLTGYYYYEPLPEAFKNFDEFEYNRRVTYFGSYRHFLKSVYENTLEDQGYQIEVFPMDINNAFIEIKNENNTGTGKVFVIKADSMKVFYFFDDDKMPIAKNDLTARLYLFRRESMIYPTNEPFLIRKNGTSPKLTFVIHGLLALKSFANSLPEDYTPPEY